MEKTLKALLAAIATVAAASCAKEPAQPGSIIPEGKVEVTFTATLDGTKANLDGLKVEWEENDAIAILDGTTVNRFEKVGGEGSTAIFYGTVTEGATDLYAVYPYSASYTLTDGNFVSVSVPTTQYTYKDKIDPSGLIMAGMVDDGAIAFRNAVSIAKFTVAEDGVKKVTFQGNASEKCAGAFKISISESGVNPTEAASSTITVLCGEGDCFAQGDYYFAIAQAGMSSGISISYQTDKALKFKTSSNPALFEKNKATNLGTLSGNVLPLEIGTAEELRTWAANSASYPKDVVVKLTADIDLSGEAWTIAERLYCTFDGQNHRISGLQNVVTGSRAGFISTTGDGYGATLKNICFGSADYDFSTGSGTYDGTSKIQISSTADWSYAGIVGYAHNTTVFENVVTFIPITATADCAGKTGIGGLAGTSKADVSYINCVNYGAITAEATASTKEFSIGGITGRFDGLGDIASGCVNNGAISTQSASSGLCMGGIVGKNLNYDNCRISGCTNNGSVSMTAVTPGTSYFGGIIGYDSSTKETCTTVENCTNNGAVGLSKIDKKSTIAFGGIAGAAYGIVTGCTNNAKLTLSGASNNHTIYVGGIVGGKVPSKEICYCTQNAQISFGKGKASVCRVGGIAAYFDPASSVMHDCTVSASADMYASRGSGVLLGALIAYSLPAIGQDCTACEGCKVDCKFSWSQNVFDAKNAGILVGQVDISATTPDHTIFFGSASKPVTVKSRAITMYNDAGTIHASFSQDNYLDYVTGGNTDHDACMLDFSNVILDI